MERCGFFDAHLVGNEYDRVYLAEQFASYFASFIGNGIFGNKLNELQVLSMETPAMQIRIQEGQGWINGYWYENMSELHLPIEVADGVLSRIDSVVLRLGIAERNMWIAVKKGTPSYEPIAPEVTRNDDYFELQLATVWIGAGYTNIKQSDITDTRWNTDVCGVVTGLIQQLDTSDYGKQLQSFIDEYTAKSRNDYENYVAKLDELKLDATQDKDNYFTDLQALYALCNAAYQEFLVYLAGLKSNGDDSLESLKSWIENLKQLSSAEINRLIEELRGLISEDIVPQIVLRLTDLEQEMPTKVPKPVGSDLKEGIVYLNEDGTTKLVEDREQVKKFKYSIILDNGLDANPAAIEYADDCSSFIEAQGSNMNDWANTDLYRKYFRPCVIEKDAAEPKYFLQQDNMTLKEDGTPAIIDGTDGDVMIQVKKLYGKVTSLENKLKFTILNYKEDDSCFCFNEIDGEEREYIYISAFECHISQVDAYECKPDSIMSSGTNNFTSVNMLFNLQDVILTLCEYDAELIGECISFTPFLVQKGIISSNYLLGYYYLTYQLYQWMFLFLYKTKDTMALGKGADLQTFVYSEGGTAGYSCEEPFCSCFVIDDKYTFSGNPAIKFLGIENFYGNVLDVLDRLALEFIFVQDETTEEAILSEFLLFYKDNSLTPEEVFVKQINESEISESFGLKFVKQMKTCGKSSFLFPCNFDDASSLTYWRTEFYAYDDIEHFGTPRVIFASSQSVTGYIKNAASSMFSYFSNIGIQEYIYCSTNFPTSMRLTKFK